MQSRYSISLVTAPTGHAVNTQELRDHLRFSDSSFEETLIQDYLNAAEEYVQGISGKQLLTATYDLKLYCFPYGQTEWSWTPLESLVEDGAESSQLLLGNALGRIYWPQPPLQSVTWIKYTDSNGTQQTLDSSKYTVQVGTAEFSGYIQPAFGEVWPVTRGYDMDVTVRAVCGFGTKEDVPEAIRQQIRMLAFHWFNNRSAVSAGNVGVTPLGFDALEVYNRSQAFI